MTENSHNLPLWFEQLAARLRDAGAPTEITSGLACVHYRLAETTKDCDIWLPLPGLETFKQVINQTSWQEKSAQFRSPLSAPLDKRWLEGGWSAHLHWLGQPSAHLDVFGALPREIHDDESPETFSPHGRLARVKMSQRDKDWPVVHQLGQLLLKEDNPTGLLFIQDGESIVAAKPKIHSGQWELLAEQRPLLGIAQQDQIRRLDAGIRTERLFWQTIDRLRLNAYRAAGKDYSRAAQKIPNIDQTLLEQNAKLVELAEKYLPTHPLAGKVSDIIAQSKETALELVDTSKFDPNWLPLKWAQLTLEHCVPPAQR